jgi:hypothetical protein
LSQAGEAAKAGDHVPVAAGEIGGAGIAESLEQWQRHLLHRQVFFVHQRHQPDLARQTFGKPEVQHFRYLLPITWNHSSA